MFDGLGLNIDTLYFLARGIQGYVYHQNAVSAGFSMLTFPLYHFLHVRCYNVLITVDWAFFYKPLSLGAILAP